MEFWIVQTLNAISFAMLLFLLCAGLFVIFGLMNILNLSHGSSYLLGAYIGLQVSRGASLLNLSSSFILRPRVMEGLSFSYIYRFRTMSRILIHERRNEERAYVRR